jgi:hypothetical protein
MNKKELISLGFKYIRHSGIGGQDMYAGMDIWKLPYNNGNSYLTFRGHEKHLHWADDFNTQFSDIKTLKEFVFRKIKKIL